MINLDSDRELIRFIKRNLDIDANDILILDDESEYKIVIMDESVPEEDIDVLSAKLEKLLPRDVTATIVQKNKPESIMTPAVSEEFKMRTEAVSEAIEKATESAVNAIKKNLREGQERTMVKLGDEVRVENTDGGVAGGVVVDVKSNYTAEEWGSKSMSATLYEYWSEKGIDIPKSDTPIEVDLDNGGVYSYPRSKVTKVEKDITMVSGVSNRVAETLRNAGYETVEDLKEASQSELSDSPGISNALAARIKANIGEAEVDKTELTHVGYVCPNCDDSFTENSDEAIEGDEGEMYCSLSCLNKELSS